VSAADTGKRNRSLTARLVLMAAGNPWGPGATTLEWTLSSPPPFHQFNTLPRIK